MTSCSFNEVTVRGGKTMTSYYVTHGTADFLSKYYIQHRREGLFYLHGQHETMLLDNTGSKKSPFVGGTTYDIISTYGQLNIHDSVDSYIFSLSSEDELFLKELVRRIVSNTPEGLTYLAFGKRHHQTPFSLILGWENSQARVAFKKADYYHKLEKLLYDTPAGQLDYGIITNYNVSNPEIPHEKI